MFSRVLHRCTAAVSINNLPTRRHYHPQTAQFFVLDPRGGIASSNVRVQMGSPGESYVMVTPEVGSAFKNHIFSREGGSDATMVNLTFFHDAQLFTHGSLSSIPQLRIPRNLPRLSGLNSSPATLYLCGGMHIIVLDGPDDVNQLELSAGCPETKAITEDEPLISSILKGF